IDAPFPCLLSGAMERAFSPSLSGGFIPGALPQAGMKARRWRYYYLEVPAIDRVAAQLLLDPQQLIVFRVAVAAAARTGLALTPVGRHSQIGNRRILRFTGAMAKHGRVGIAMGELDRIERLREGSDLIDLDQNGVGRAGFDALPQKLHVRHE